MGSRLHHTYDGTDSIHAAHPFCTSWPMLQLCIRPQAPVVSVSSSPILEMLGAETPLLDRKQGRLDSSLDKDADTVCSGRRRVSLEPVLAVCQELSNDD